MYAVEWVIGLTLLGLVIGAAVGWFVVRRRPLGDARARELEARAQELESRARDSEQRSRELEQELEAARHEQERYREQVVDEFSETARKFKTLNAAYGDLHRQLAVSSSALCGDMVEPRLEPPRADHAAMAYGSDDGASDPESPEPAERPDQASPHAEPADDAATTRINAP